MKNTENNNGVSIVFKPRFASMVQLYRKKLDVLPINEKNIKVGSELLFFKHNRDTKELFAKDVCSKVQRAYISSSGLICVEGQYILNETEMDFLSNSYGCNTFFEFLNIIKNKYGLPLLCHIIKWHGR